MTPSTLPRLRRVFTLDDYHARDAFVARRVDNDCDGCERTFYADGEGWTPAEDCPVHGIDASSWWYTLNLELDARWPGRWVR
jgi:hypothetical protein